MTRKNYKHELAKLHIKLNDLNGMEFTSMFSGFEKIAGLISDAQERIEELESRVIELECALVDRVDNQVQHDEKVRLFCEKHHIEVTWGMNRLDVLLDHFEKILTQDD